MDSLVIQGGQALSGSLEVKGSKNAAFAIIGATLLSPEDFTLHNIPHIGDVMTLLDLMRSMGAVCEWRDEALHINTAEVNPEKLDFSLMKRIRGSLALLGPLAARFDNFRISSPGGCKIGSRSIETHLAILKQFGCEIESQEEFFYISKKKAPQARIILSEFSVTGTEIAVMAAVGFGQDAERPQEVEIRIAAGADHPVRDLCWMLEAMGAGIVGQGSATLHIAGGKKLHGVDYTITPDPIEAGTFLALAGAAREPLLIRNVPQEFLFLELATFQAIGIGYELLNARRAPNGHYDIFDLQVHKANRLSPIAKLHDMPAPGFLPDLLQPFAVLLTQADGASIIYDWMYDGRLKYVQELKKMGADMTVLDAHRVTIVGPTPLYGKEITSFDLRAGATLIIAALIAEGESIIHNIHQVDRGYEDIVSRLTQIGAKISRQ